MSTNGRLSGRRVLVVEDQYLIAMDLERTLQKAGCEVVGPVGRLKPALELAHREPLDFGLLDVNLFGEKVFAVAEALESRGIPFVLTTGYDEGALPADRNHWRIVGKPYDCDRVVDLILATLGDGPSPTIDGRAG